MKLKSIIHLLGWKPKPRKYGYEVVSFSLPRDGQVRYAQWLHPKEARKTIGQSHVDSLRNYLSEGDVAIDIGAHAGDSTLPLALAAGRAGCVLAVEPNPYLAEILRKNAELNPEKTSIEVLNVAATEDDGPIVLEYSDPGYCNGGHHQGISKWVHGHAFSLKVPGRNLERYLRRERPELIGRLRFIKVDTEGYDATVLESMKRLILETRPFIKAEFYKHLKSGSRLRQWAILNDLGYDMFRILDADDSPGERIAEDNLMKWQHFDVLCFPKRPLAQHRLAG